MFKLEGNRVEKLNSFNRKPFADWEEGNEDSEEVAKIHDCVLDDCQFYHRGAFQGIICVLRKGQRYIVPTISVYHGRNNDQEPLIKLNT